MQIVIATRNAHKLKEITQILKVDGVEFLSLNDFPECPEAEEAGRTFADNALLKAQTVAHHSGCWALADDSGLEVDALEGRPGVHSARYAGEVVDPLKNIQKLLAELKDLPRERRTARFVCALALVSNHNRAYFAEGKIEGVIIKQPQGQDGFGYDPVFLLPELGKTMAQLSPEEKNGISHRTLALKKIAPLIASLSAQNRQSCPMA
ncbi:XTP/dITP diphosphatase [candidate division TA06 bacterium]|uniref:dITP/XTP pyrophosphatase n=1 Tax=candidate division TA06 bacterium TaxID=2250710 RepID=A0A933MLJ6_UNCT6|nr:XTP/dITP diphosphatase [candidate division TA06 bacterium]